MDARYSTLLSSTNKADPFYVTSQDISIYGGYSVNVDVTSPVGLYVTFTLEGSLDNSTWNEVEGTEVAIETTDSIIYNVSQVSYRYFRVYCNIGAGSANIEVKTVTKG